MLTVQSQDAQWALQTTQFQQLYLVELRNVSRGSWQPVICRRIDL